MDDLDRLAAIATGRSESVFAPDLAASDAALTAAIAGKRILVIGGAGSIGSATVRLIADRRPAALHIVDQSENNLAELVRSLRGRPAGLEVGDFRTFPVDYGSPVLRYVLDGGPWDAVLNFAALKHVRSEGDAASLLQMLDTNLLKTRALMRGLAARGFEGRFFCVSTDKAANPVSLMGASKRVMEHLIFSGVPVPEFRGQVTSARFANVAFSDGSLLHGFTRRIALDQPIPAPRDTRRYFVSPGESGEICALAAFLAPPGSIVVPDFESAIQLKRLEDVAADFIRAQGLEPVPYEAETDARVRVTAERANGRYPLLLTPLDTSGEKPYEEFVGDGETALRLDWQALAGVGYVPSDAAALDRLLTLVEAAVTGDADPAKGDLADAIAAVVPAFRHRETGRHLDQRL